MAKINLKPITDFAGQLLDVAVYGLMIGAVYKVYDHVTGYQVSKPVGYGDAVEAIMRSEMWSSDKRIATAALKTIATSEYYKAVIHIVKDVSTFSGDKVEMIKKISE